jgi:phosphatidylserine decarboxylase
MGLTRYGRREWLIASGVAALAVTACAWWGWWWAVPVPVVLWLAVALFFRDPLRRVPRDLPPEVMLSPADGRVSAIVDVEGHEVVEGPATVIRIFLSVLNVHVNRSPGDGQVTGLAYRPGRFHDARTPECAEENESQLIAVRLDDGPAIGVRQIAGKVARRIVCDLRTGDRLRRGVRFGMIKFGSSTELILPRSHVAMVHVRAGDRVKGGITILATLQSPDTSST